MENVKARSSRKFFSILHFSIVMLEIERKFLVNDTINGYLKSVEPKPIRQGYIMDDPSGKTVRVRTKGTKGFLTIKGKTTGISRSEFEYEIPFSDATALLNDFCDRTLEKDRYAVVHEGKTWDVDVFHGKLEGLIVAEIELGSEDEAFALPAWAEKEVSDDPRYYNVNLIKSGMKNGELAS
jgi:adenylate cyclase